MEAWKVNLISVWLGCFFTGLAMSQILPFLPLYVEQLGVSDHQSLSLWSGLVFSGTFWSRRWCRRCGAASPTAKAAN